MGQGIGNIGTYSIKEYAHKGYARVAKNVFMSMADGLL